MSIGSVINKKERRVRERTGKDKKYIERGNNDGGGMGPSGRAWERTNMTKDAFLAIKKNMVLFNLSLLRAKKRHPSIHPSLILLLLWI